MQKDSGNTVKYCDSYVGFACVNGSCPKANREEYQERGIPFPKSCDDCFWYKGCEDCALSGTEYCTKEPDNQQSNNQTKTK